MKHKTIDTQDSDIQNTVVTYFKLQQSLPHCNREEKRQPSQATIKFLYEEPDVGTCKVQQLNDLCGCE